MLRLIDQCWGILRHLDLKGEPYKATGISLEVLECYAVILALGTRATSALLQTNINRGLVAEMSRVLVPQPSTEVQEGLLALLDHLMLEASFKRCSGDRQA
ncbi:MAG: hypothetical protein HY815_10610 [Candidatus Riflebacteria bacterium]|nr:hypothetical protein [Candidatus Riflebacteria bacterium]